MPSPAVPTLDLRRHRAGGREARGFAEAVVAALSDAGFLNLVGHGIDRDLIRGAYEAAGRFFGLGVKEKSRYENPRLKGQRGYVGFGREHARDHPAPDLKEFWHVGRPGDPAGYENVWPAAIPEFRPCVEALYERLDACAMELLDAVTAGLDLPAGLLRKRATNGSSLLRLAFYPSVPACAHPESMRAAPHEDINLITLLCEATAPGLEILLRDGRWAPVETVPGAIVVDSGDMLQNLTNGLLRSTTHRVVNPVGDCVPRLSMPFFVHPRPEADLTPLPECVARTGGQPLYPSWTAGEFLAQRLREIGLA